VGARYCTIAVGTFQSAESRNGCRLTLRRHANNTPAVKRGLVPEWRNWQTRRTQNPVLARAWEFDPPSGGGDGFTALTTCHAGNLCHMGVFFFFDITLRLNKQWLKPKLQCRTRRSIRDVLMKKRSSFTHRIRPARTRKRTGYGVRTVLRPPNGNGAGTFYDSSPLQDGR
jgi:hypothetical protein